MLFYFVDTDSSVVEEYKKTLSRFNNVLVEQGNILKIADTCVVSPANSFGYMDGGIDAGYVNFFGYDIQERVFSFCEKLPGKHLPVGDSELFRTGNQQIPYMLMAPTVYDPGPASPENIYRSMRSIIKTTEKHKDLFQKIYLPGLGTGVGELEPAVSARQVREALEDYYEAGIVH